MLMGLETSGQGPSMDIIKLATVNSLIIRVVDLETAVHRHEIGLDRREIHAQDRDRGFLLGEINGPDAGASCDV